VLIILQGQHTLRQRYHGLITQLWPKDRERCDVQAKQRSCKVGQSFLCMERQAWGLVLSPVCYCSYLEKKNSVVCATDMNKTSNHVLFVFFCFQIFDCTLHWHSIKKVLEA